MMFNYPFFGFPYTRNYNRYYKYNKYYSNNLNNYIDYNKYKENNSSKNNFTNENTKNVQDNKESDKREAFEIFGLKLYSDDILILCLIFFLYNEGVKDTELFISLILLLLT